jgi:hypothetical protein
MPPRRYPCTKAVQRSSSTRWRGKPAHRPRPFSATAKICDRAIETGGGEIESIDELVNKAHGIVDANIIVHRFGQKQKLRTFESEYVSHAKF